MQTRKNLKVQKPTSILYPFQEKAVTSILEQFKTQDRTHAVMACGTGKTRVCLWVAERMLVKNIVVFAPSLALIAQLIHEWLLVSSWEKVDCLAICSDETVTRGTDNFILNPSECDFPVTTDPDTIHQFLVKPSTAVKIIFCTYHSSGVLAKSLKRAPTFELGIFDEAHKTTGDNHFSLAISNINVPIEKRLFVTATPRHYDIHHRDKDGEHRLIYSMDSEKDYGSRAFTFSFREAINLGVIADYKIMISLISSQTNLNAKTLLEEEIIALHKAIEKDKKISKIISFHKTIEEAYHFTTHVRDSELLPKFKSLHISGAIPTAMRRHTMQYFKEAKSAVISNARCLIEGIDVPAVDMVAFLSAKHSKIDIVQAVGRAIRKVPGKIHGYIFLPLFLDIKANETLEEAITRANYGEIWEVLEALSEQDQDLHATITELTQQKGKTGEISEGLGKYVEIFARDKFEIKYHEYLKKAITVRIIDKIGSLWDERYGQLMGYKEKWGDCNVPAQWPENKTLANWVATQRLYYKKGSLSQAKITHLEKIDFDWTPFGSSWEQNFSQLQKYKEQHGHFRISEKHPGNKVLRWWCQAQRIHYKKNTLSKDKIARLEQIGFDWMPVGLTWHRYYKQLQKYKEQHGNCNVPLHWPENKNLGAWVGRQRRFYKKDVLGQGEVADLEKIGFDWSPIDSTWDHRIKQLKKYREKYGHLRMSWKQPEYKSLRHWCRKQRVDYKKNILSQDKIQRLEKIGFDWSPRLNKKKKKQT